MLTYTIRKQTETPKKAKPTATKVTPVKQVLLQEILDAAAELDREEIFQRHRRRCYLKPGDTIKFKRPKRGAPKGVVDYIEEDVNKVFWDGAGATPRYIRLRMDNGQFMWVCENKILFVKGSGK